MTRLTCFLLAALSIAFTAIAVRAATDVGSDAAVPLFLRWATPSKPEFAVRAIARPPSAELQVAQAVPLATPPAAPTKPPQTVFSDHFPGTELASVWEVVNRNPDNYIVEGGNLLIIARSVGGFGSDKSQNIFRLNKPMPDSNWVITVTLNVKFQTLRESFAFGLLDDPQNYLAAQLYARSTCCGYSDLVLQILKISGGQTTQFDVPVTPTKTAAQPISVRLTREGHEYRASVNFAGEVDNVGNLVWVDTGSVTSLHAPKTFALSASQSEQTSGESPFRIISVTIEAPAK
jgi:hypothetical protein